MGYQTKKLKQLMINIDTTLIIDSNFEYLEMFTKNDWSEFINSRFTILHWI